MSAGMKRLVVSVVCAQALVLGACGGPVTETQQEEVGTSQDAILLCDGSQEWNREYYTDSTYTTWVGSETCLCNGSLELSGTKSRYYLTAFYACY